MRIAIVNRAFSRAAGGAESYAVALAEQLAARHDVHIFAQESNHPVAGVTYHRVFCLSRKPRWVNQLLFAIASWWATRQGFDMVHSHENTWHGQIQTVHVRPLRYNLFQGRTGWRRCLQWLRVMLSPRLLVYLWLEGARFKPGPGRQIVATSDTLRDECVAAYPASRGFLTVVTPGVDLLPVATCVASRRVEARRSLGLPLEGRLVLFVANDYARKGLDALLKALAQLPPDAHLAVVGSRKPQTHYSQQARQLGLAERVHFLGPLAQVGPAYQAADMLAHPTLEDSYGMVVLEGMAHGLPVVVSGPAHCGISSDLQDGVQALLLKDPRDASCLSDLILRLLTDSALAQALAKQGRAFAAQHSWERAAQRYEAMYQGKPMYRQRWLVLAHAFNMDGRASSQTITDKVPHLRAAGIELVVLSGVSGVRDRALEHHQLWPSGPAGIRFELRHVLRRRFHNPVVYRMLMTLASLLLLPGLIIEKLLRPVESSWSWWLSAYLQGRALARIRPFDLIYSTGGAFAAHLAGHALKRRLRTPWFAEVHDPFITPGSTPQTSQQKMQARVEALICREADVAVWFTEQALASARRRHPELGERGKMMIPGIDPPFKELPPYRPGPKFVVGHFGSLSATRNLVPFIEALETLQTRRPELVAATELQVTGGPLDAVSAARIDTSPVRACVRHLGRIEADPVSGLSGREQILRRMRSVDVLLLLHGEEPICEEYIPSKLYEYLWMQRPILATVYRNPQMAAMLREQGHDSVKTGDQGDTTAEFVKALETLFDRWVCAELPDSGRNSPYTTQAAVGQVLMWADEVQARALESPAALCV